MRNLLFFAFCFFTSIQIAATQDVSPILFSLSGKAKYIPADGGKSIRLSPGDTLPLDGRIKLKGNSNIGIYYDYSYIYFNGNGVHSLAPLKESSQLKESDLAETLGEQLIEVLHPYYRTIQATKSGFGTTGTGPVRPPKDKEKDGHGDGDVQLVRVSPLSGKVAGNTITFSWEPKEDYATINEFTLSVMDSDEEIIHQQNVSGRSSSIAVATLGLQEDSEYSWKVSASTDKNISSGIVSFEYTSSSVLQEINASMQADDCWKNATASARLLMEAAVLEANDFISLAEHKFATAYRNDRKNPLAESLYKAFLWRYDLIK